MVRDYSEIHSHVCPKATQQGFIENIIWLNNNQNSKGNLIDLIRRESSAKEWRKNKREAQQRLSALKSRLNKPTYKFHRDCYQAAIKGRLNTEKLRQYLGK